MSKKNSIKLFEDKLVRSVWDDEKEEWYFCVNDVIQLLTDTVNVNSYLKTLRNRDEESQTTRQTGGLNTAYKARFPS